MKVASDKTLTPTQVRAAAQSWYDRQLELSAQCLGSLWPGHRVWIEAYLRAELRERLIALGWRANNAR